MNRKHIFLLIALPIFLLAAGCSQNCTAGQYTQFQMIQDEPLDGVVINDLTPHFGWHHNNTCDPKYTRLTISRKSMTGNNMHYRPGYLTGWTLNYDLEPGGEYFWSIAAYETVSIKGLETSKKIFYTGPVCTSNENLQAPVAKAPANGQWWEDNPSKRFEWYYPGNCLPDGYIYQFALDPQFSYLLGTGTLSGYEQHMYKPINFPDCSTIYWRLAAKAGNNTGPYSAASSFTWAQSPDCWQMNVQSPTMALIEGKVYLDDCGFTSWPVAIGPQTAPPGCVINGGFGFTGDGVRQNNESNINDVRVDLGAGPCPSTGLDQATANPKFKFIVQLPGTYCISISKNQPGSPHADFNFLDLTDGVWTDPLSHNIVTQETVTLQEGMNIYKLDIGWDEYDQLWKWLAVTEDSFCRIGPSKLHRAVTTVAAGERIPIFGRNPGGTWFETFVNGVPCLISIASGEPEGEVMELEIFGLYPDPEPEPATEPSDKPSDVNCSEYSSERSCESAGCYWTPPGLIPSKCVPK